jgi:signal peptidase I
MRIENDHDGWWHSEQRLPYVPDFDSNSVSDDVAYPTRGSGKGAARDIIETVVITLLIFFMVRSVVQNFRVEGDSMLPTLHTEERLLVNSGLYYRYDANFLSRLFNPDLPTDMRYLFHGPQRGDIIVFQAPIEDKDFIKRVIATEGETVQIRADKDPVGDPKRDCGGCGVFVNGVKLNEPYIKQSPDYNFPPDGGVYTVPQDRVFVMGDNRRNSSDSHIFPEHAITVESIVGTAFVSYWPQDHWGLLPHPTYAEIKQK